MAYRQPRLAWLAPAMVLAAAVAIGVSVWSSRTPAAPADPGVCWRADLSGQAPRFTRTANDLDGLEGCAAFIEDAFRKERRPVAGAFQGRWLFVDQRAVWTATKLDGPRWRLWFDPQRAAVDARLDKLDAARAQVRQGVALTARRAPPT